VKSIRCLTLSLLATCVCQCGAIADELDDQLANLGQVAINGNFDYPLRATAAEINPAASDPRVARFRAAIVQARARTFGAAADAAVLPDLTASNLPEIPQREPTTGQSFTTDAARIALLWIAPGTLRMSALRGSDDDTLVTLSRGYWLGRTEVTQAQWAAIMDNLPRPSRYKGANRPVEQVSWVSAMAFCRKMSEMERAAGRLPPGYEYSLPTEAEWEFACRAGDDDRARVPVESAWYGANSGRVPHAVGQKQPNAWGLYDMQGNVWEWCVDGYQGYPGGQVTDLQGDVTAPSAATFRILRGGSFASPLGQCRTDYRAWNMLNASNPSVGFRLALVPQKARAPTAAAPTEPAPDVAP